MRWIILVFLVGSVARILTVIVSPDDYVMSSAPSLDQGEYLALAHNLKVHHTLPFGDPHRWGQNGNINATGPFILCAPRAQLYPLFIVLFWGGSGTPKRWIIAVQIIRALAIQAPWTVRNFIVTGKFVPIAAQGWGANLYFCFATIDVPCRSGNPWTAYGSDMTVLDIIRRSPTESVA